MIDSISVMLRGKLTIALMTTAICAWVPLTFGQSTDAAQSDWPCIQRLVPNVSAAVLWPLPIDDDNTERWRENAEISGNAKRWGDIDVIDDGVRSAIQQFSESVPLGDREERLTLLAVGIVATANERRSLFIDGIKRYTRQQNAVAKQVEALINESERLKSQTDDAAKTRLVEVEETLHWHQRVFDQREKAIISLCEQPVAVEENLGEVLREIAQYLP